MTRFWPVLFALVLLTSPAAADVLADLAYGEHEQQVLDVHQPDRPGPHPWVLYVHGGDFIAGDKRDLGLRVDSLLAEGFAVVSANYRLAPESSLDLGLDDLSSALAFAHANAEALGLDRDRVVLFGEGSGANLAALLAGDSARQRAAGLPLDWIDGLALSDGPYLDFDVDSLARLSLPQFNALALALGSDETAWTDAAPYRRVPLAERLPPMLVLSASADSLSERYAMRLRERGVPANWQRLVGDPAQPGDGGMMQTTQWLKSLGLGRVQRFESLSYSPSFRAADNAYAAIAIDADRAGNLLGVDGRLYATVDALSSGESFARVLRLDAAADRWQTEHRFPLGVRRVSLLRDIVLGDALGQSRFLLAVTESERDGSQVWLRDSRGSWSTLVVPAAFAQARVRDGLSARAQTWLLAEGRSGGIWRLALNAERLPSLFEKPELAINGGGAGLAELDGQLYAVAHVAHGPSQIYRRVGDGSWLAMTASDPGDDEQAGALGSAIDPVSGRGLLLIAHAENGRITRFDPATAAPPVLEFEIGPALAGLWQDREVPIGLGRDGFKTALHPETNEQLSLLGITRAHPDSPNPPFDGAYFLVRQSSGHYSLASVHDFDGATWPKAGVSSYAQSPFQADQGRRWYFAGAGFGDASNRGWIEQGQLNLTEVKRGPWWDRARNGFGFDLQKIGEQWALLFYGFDDDGAPTWWSALGRIENQRFIANDNGLMQTRQFFRDGNLVTEIDAANSGSVAIRFGLKDGEGACADGHSRRDAKALAELSIELPTRVPTRWCIEPMQLRTAGHGEFDANGLWAGGMLDTGWGLSVITQGAAQANAAGVVAYYFDAKGAPRWALGVGQQVDGRSTLAMLNIRNACATCETVVPQSSQIGEVDLQAGGSCGAVDLRASIELRYPDEPGSLFRRDNVTLSRINESACY